MIIVFSFFALDSFVLFIVENGKKKWRDWSDCVEVQGDQSVSYSNML